MYKRISWISLFIIPVLIISVIVIAAIKDKYDLKWFIAFVGPFCMYLLLVKLFNDVLSKDKSKFINPVTISIFTFLICVILNILISYSHTKMIIVSGENIYRHKYLRDGEIIYIDNKNGLKDSIVIDTKYIYIYNQSDFDLEYYKVYYSSHYYNRNDDYSHIIKPNKIFKIKEELDYKFENPPISIMVHNKSDNQYRTGIIKKQNYSNEINNK